jgi:ribose/xylose/arabinose/galactoside ABC-type transport system permease subunit
LRTEAAKKVDTGTTAGSLLVQFVARYDFLIVVLFLVVLGTLCSEKFLAADNLINVLRQVSIIGTAALGATFIILTGGIDLSVGPVMIMGTMFVGIFQQWPVHVTIPLVLIITTFCGGINGALIAYLRFPSFIATFATMSAFGGIAYVVSTGIRVVITEKAWWTLGSGLIGSWLPIPVVVFLGTALCCWAILNYTRFGRNTYGLGVNETAVVYSGHNVPAIKLGIYALAGLLAGLAGVLLAGRLREADPGLVFYYTLDCIAAVALGGTQLEGGFGSIGRTVAGVLVIGLINNIMNLLNIPAYYQQAIKGVIIVASLAVFKKRLN